MNLTTALAAFYVPVSIMIGLYYQVPDFFTWIIFLIIKKDLNNCNVDNMAR